MRTLGNVKELESDVRMLHAEGSHQRNALSATERSWATERGWHPEAICDGQNPDGVVGCLP